MANSKIGWQKIGVCGMDAAGLLIADPCYVIHQEGRKPSDLEILDYEEAWVKQTGEVVQLRYKAGHEGAGVIVHSPQGDGTVDIWADLDHRGQVRSVFFSFAGDEPYGVKEV